MNSDNQQVIYCEDGEYKVFCNLCDELCTERFYENHLKSQTHTNDILKREQLNMTLLFEVCYRSIIENESEYNKYLATLRKENDMSLYKTYTINNINLDEVNKILNDYISTHNRILIFILSILNL